MLISADVLQREKGLILERSNLAEYPRISQKPFLCNSEGGGVAILISLYQRAIGSSEDAMQCSSHFC
jgi:hypothetical protein